MSMREAILLHFLLIRAFSFKPIGLLLVFLQELQKTQLLTMQLLMLLLLTVFTARTILPKSLLALLQLQPCI